ncbi:hypothetical protein GQ43DRAFT_501043 [Delitschia confertaspora ATCC 74209]|uniref:Uncharacterized protein n=1 Tax=Delitschia confertaspora ATCC 74209 TaxID=1513339 RepID=A0A9P4JYI7_9PLEO|nr:hypothetical protein GQ43DRAFT_501043 [Delitschia confertaspora ATCC 74209]
MSTKPQALANPPQKGGTFYDPIGNENRRISLSVSAVTVSEVHPFPPAEQLMDVDHAAVEGLPSPPADHTMDDDEVVPTVEENNSEYNITEVSKAGNAEEGSASGHAGCCGHCGAPTNWARLSFSKDTPVMPISPGPSPLSDAAGVENVTPSPLPPQFKCRFDDHNECRTGQTDMKLARKTISDHFGRNKAATRAIKDWPMFCRKHYQRATYKSDQWQLRKCMLINNQFASIEKQFPGMTYEIVLKKSENLRLNGYYLASANGQNSQAAAQAFAPNDSNKKNYEAPIPILRELGHYLGKNKSRNDVQKVVALVRDMLKKDEVKQFPALEFLPMFPEPTSTRRSAARATAASSISATAAQ